MEPVDFIAKLAALVPKLRVNQTRFHGVFAPNNKDRAKIVPGKKTKSNETKASEESSNQIAPKHRAGRHGPNVS